MEEVMMWLIISGLVGFFMPFVAGYFMEKAFHASNEASYTLSVVIVLAAFLILFLSVSSAGDKALAIVMLYVAVFTLPPGQRRYARSS